MPSMSAATNPISRAWVATLALALSAGAPVGPAAAATGAAATVVVRNCNDGGAGSLRAAVSNAPDGAVIDLRSLACRRITLTSGAIAMAQDSLTLLGRGRYALTLDAVQRSQVLRHTGQGTLRVSGLSVVNGLDLRNFASGGCIHSEAQVAVENSIVRDCQAIGQRNPDDECELVCPQGAVGGAISARQVRLVRTTVANSRADVPFDSTGGGVYASERLLMFDSRLSWNLATYGTGAFVGREFVAHDSLIDHNGIGFEEPPPGERGAVYVLDGRATLVRSAVVDNVASGCAGICVEGFGAGEGRGAMVDSTVARNRGGSILSFSQEALVANSTLAVNQSCSGAVSTPRLMLDSSIVALNTCDGIDLDIAAPDPRATVTGSHNLVRRSQLPLPPDTLRGHPRLQALRDNGGPTPSMALLDGSPAIGRGSNPLELTTDQRGRGFPRERDGVDIGAVER